MPEQLTPQQQQAISDRGGKLLVSAAAGSGKTKVLVDRLLSYITDPMQPADLDDFLIITYTKAAAAELRAKIASKLTERISNDPENRHLQQQLQRLYLTKISTVHSFCADVLREYAYQLDISADFRVADENECLSLQAYVMEQLLDQAYAEAASNTDFFAFIDSQGLGRDDRQIPEIILKVYHSAKCHLNPEQWLNWCMLVAEDQSHSDVGQTIWGSYLIEDLHNYLDLQIQAISKCISSAQNADNMEKSVALLNSTVDQLYTLRNCTTWDDIRSHMNIDYGVLRFSAKCTDMQLAQEIKAVRDACKKGVLKKLRWFSDSSEQALADMRALVSSVRGLVTLVKKFDQAYGKVKQARHVLDFGDLEHKMLDLLLGRSRSGQTLVATEIGCRFREVMVDEYQDSNEVQDAIFSALTQKEQNCFMVGDVKQSIYQFRLADPGIFLKKYNEYVFAEEAKPKQGRKVLLSSNFRSSDAVIQTVNEVFSTCMSPQIGGLAYGEQEMLKEGVKHIALDDQAVELYGIDVTEDTYAEEATFVANRICQLLDGKHMIRQGETLRPILPDDIVILLRSPGSVGAQFQYALEQRGIRCDIGGTTDLLQSEEVETLIALLKVINNPLQDIPLVAVLSSRICGFTADDLATLRYNHKQCSMYEALVDAQIPKAKNFVSMLMKLRRDAQMLDISKLLTRIFAATRMDSIYSALHDGILRVENLQSFCQIAANYEKSVNGGLAQFLHHLEIVANRGLAAPGEQNTSGAVTIMSIHKSKGLEFPVVVLAGLSRVFNRESIRAQVLCDKQLGLGLTCVDRKNRIRYPAVSKRSIGAKITAENLSEEMRVLYVAMTRAKDRLIMTYAVPDVRSEMEALSLRMKFSDLLLLTSDADCPGWWVLMTALKHGWHVQYVQGETLKVSDAVFADEMNSVPLHALERLKTSLSFHYAYTPATFTPSKQTATQMKGRFKDSEAAENTTTQLWKQRNWRKPSFIMKEHNGIAYGNVYHTVLQYICYTSCSDLTGVEKEIDRLVEQGYISVEQAKLVDAKKICALFATEIGQKMQKSANVIREFKFSVLQNAQDYYVDVKDDKILIQGVVDCALIEDDGITVIDFKTDNVSKDTICLVADKYRLQLRTYAKALAQIYQKPIKTAVLYFFGMDELIRVL